MPKGMGYGSGGSRPSVNMRPKYQIQRDLNNTKARMKKKAKSKMKKGN